MNPNTPAEIFMATVQLSWRASWLIALVVVLRVLLRGRLPADVWFWAWIVVGLRLLLPFSISTSASPYNWSHRVAAASAITTPVPVMESAGPLAPSFAAVSRAPADRTSSVAAMPVAVSPEPANASEAALPRSPVAWRSIVAGAWFAVAAAILLVRVVATARFARRLRSCPVLDDARLQTIVADEAERLGLSNAPACLETNEVQAPALFGLRRPVLLFPRGLIAQLSDEELRLVVLHELGHQCRRDLLAHALLQVAAAVHWFNPLVWLAIWLARTDCELACDAFVLRKGRTTLESYGRALLRVVGATRAAYGPGAIVVSIVESKQQLARRVRMISEFRRPAAWQSVVAVAVVAAVAAIGVTRETRAEATSTPTPRQASTAIAKEDGASPAPAPTVSFAAAPAAAATPAATPKATTVRPGASDAGAASPGEAHRAAAITIVPGADRAESNLVGIDDRRDMLRDRLKAAAVRRDDLQRDLNLLETRLKLLADYRQRNADVATLPFIGGDGLVQRLQDQIAQRKIDMATLLHRYGERHPDVVRETQALQELSSGLEAAIDAAAQRLQAQRDTRAAEVQVAAADYTRAADDASAFESEVSAYEMRKLAAQDRDVAIRSPAAEKKPAALAETTSTTRAGDFSVSVVGAVNHQAGVVFSAQDKPMVLDAIARAGGFSPTANRSGVRILRLQPDGSRRPIALSEADVMSGTGEAAHIQRGDAIIVSERPAPQYVTLLGAVNIAGRVELPSADQPRMTLIELLGRAGGANRLADLRHVRITRAPGGTAETQVVNLADVLSGKTPSPNDLKAIELEPGDVITIPERIM